MVWSKQIDALMWGEEAKWQREEAAGGGVRDAQGFYVKKTSSSERDKTQTEGEKDTLWKRGELIRHPAFISCELRVRAPTPQWYLTQRVMASVSGHLMRCISNRFNWRAQRQINMFNYSLCIQASNPSGNNADPPSPLLHNYTTLVGHARNTWLSYYAADLNPTLCSALEDPLSFN